MAFGMRWPTISREVWLEWVTHQTFTETSPSGNHGVVGRSIVLARMASDMNVVEDASD
jgi:hypothetical protein